MKIAIILATSLDMNWCGHQFYITSMLLGMADTVKKLKAVCSVSGSPAGKTFKKTGAGDGVELGATEFYEAGSNEHWGF